MRLAGHVFSVLAVFFLRASPAVAATEVPFQYREGLLWVEVNVSQSERPLNFLLDTGASASVLDLNTARKLGLKLGPSVTISGVHASAKGFWPVRLTAKIDQLPLPGKYVALDMSALSGVCNNAVDG